MKTIILVRHGESETNLTKKFTGQLDIELTDRGRKQAELMAQYIDRFNVDVIYASDLKRASDTAEAIRVRQGCELVKTKAFREINAGEWHGKTFEDISKKYSETYGTWKENIAKAFLNGGESCVELYDRVVCEFKKVVEESELETICIVSHATPIRMMESYMSGKGIDMAQELSWVPNASVSIYSYDGEYKTVNRGCCEFLGDMLTNLPRSI